MLANGSVLEGRYSIQRVLGSGGMGAVYLANDTRLPRQWAIKEMGENFEDEEQRKLAEESLNAEAAILSSLTHANLPRIVDFFPSQGRHYLVMDYIEGESLDQILRRGPLPLDKALDLGRQLATVLAYLHSQAKPVIFRDLKPGNIMMTPDGHAKLIDFGIARHLRPGASTDTRALGTPGYAAPEQYGRGQSDARTDIYALGATLHHALSGRNPSDAPFQFPPLRELRPEIPPALEKIVQRAVSLKPEDRFQGASDFLEALENLKQDPETYQHLPASLKTSVLPPPPSEGFQPASIFLGKLDHGQQGKAQVILYGDIHGKIKSSARWLKPQQNRVKAKSPVLDFVVDTSRLPEGGRHSAEIRLHGKPEVAALRVEVEVGPRRLPNWTYPVAFLLCAASFVPLLGLVPSVFLLLMLMGAPRDQRNGLRVMFWLAALVSAFWVGFTAVAVGIYHHGDWLWR